MPNLKRRRFLQFMGAAGIAPALPAVSVQAATSGGASHAKMLWASLHANAGTTAKFAQIAGKMGISGQAAAGIIAKTSSIQMIGARSVMRLRPRAAQSSLKSGQSDQLKDRLKRWVFEDEDDELTADPTKNVVAKTEDPETHT